MTTSRFYWISWLSEALKICRTPQETNEMLTRSPKYIHSDPFWETRHLMDHFDAESDNDRDDIPEPIEEIATTGDDGSFNDICILVPVAEETTISDLVHHSDILLSPSLHNGLPADSVPSYVLFFHNMVNQVLSHKVCKVNSSGLDLTYSLRSQEATQRLVSMCDSYSDSGHTPSGEEHAKIYR